jgi:phage/plasmid-associated DNA primase
MIISFDNVIENTSQEDKDLPNKLKQEISGIINWCLVGLKRLIQNEGKFTIPKDNKQHIHELSLTNNPVKEFVIDSDRVELAPDGFIKVTKCCELFNEFHGFKGSKEWSTRAVGNGLKKMNIISKSKRFGNVVGKYYIGLQEKINFDEQKLPDENKKQISNKKQIKQQEANF